MVLSFPSGTPVFDNETCTVQSVDRVDFNRRLNERVSKGWVISEVTSKFHKTLFGGVTSYRAELRRGSSE